MFGGNLLGQNVFFGIIYKPIVPEALFNLGNVTVENTNWNISIKPKFSNTFGMVIKKQLKNFLFLETGIIYISRKFSHNISLKDSSNFVQSFSMVGYEVPLQAIIAVPFSERWISNSGIGISADILTTDLRLSNSKLAVNYTRTSWLSAAFITNSGMEYKLKKKGAIYSGFSFHQPFKDLMIGNTEFLNSPNNKGITFGLSGAYFTLDLKYYFENTKPKQKEQNL